MNEPESFENSRLIESIRRDKLDSTLKLIDELDPKDVSKVCPITNANALFYAVQRTSDDEALEICQRILDKCPELDVKSTDISLQTALFFASRDGNVKTAEYLINNGCNVNHTDRVNQTALFYAARDGRFETVRLLLDKGANPNMSDNVGQTALFYAARDGRSQTCMLLLDNGADPSIKDKNRQAAHSYAMKSGHKQLAGILKSRVSIPAGGSVIGSAGSADNVRGGSIDSKTEGGGSVICSSSMAEGNMIRDSEIRQCYRLQFKGSDGKWYFAPKVKIEEFEKMFPNIAVWPKDSPVSNLRPNIDPFRASWYKVISDCVEDLRKQEGAWIFDKPVDEKAWNCSDYYKIVSKPMDFSLIRKKLRNGEYELCRDVVSDIEQIFKNCYLYNKPDSSISILCKAIENQFCNLKDSKDINSILARETELFGLDRTNNDISDDIKDVKMVVGDADKDNHDNSRSDANDDNNES
ncbi:protein with 4 ankyrin repeats plus a bromodomain [Cryptosporidium ryanae]|uniref:protein with 4 ankyrin repeats plus a bromodomain n=1 Tax=Cryptosporidium ryanae TaxID=515981 RepID=UPI00351A5287|nr:protein with 4 ankyrin repeats plus a bromodomain [Cryptosporidium ryanae]